MYNAHATRIMYHGMRYETRVHTGHTEARVHLVKGRRAVDDTRGRAGGAALRCNHS